MICATSPTPMWRCPQIDPDARQRLLTALINTALLARTEPTLFIIEGAHWIDAVSESCWPTSSPSFRAPHRWC
jgi:hypothetical protein